jgi:hypothetical protein
MSSDKDVQARTVCRKAGASGRVGLPVGTKHVTLGRAHDVKIGTKDFLSEHDPEC